MPYSVEHKLRTRERIVVSARRLFNRFGFAQVTIEQIMADAELTRGGFYNHFTSKEELFCEAVSSYITCNPLTTRVEETGIHPDNPRTLARMLINMYLSDEVFDNDAMHCPLYALPSDVSRTGLSQAAYTDLIRAMTGVYQMACAGDDDAQTRAESIVSLCVGGMVLARTTNDPRLRQSLRAAARDQALKLLDG